MGACNRMEAKLKRQLQLFYAQSPLDFIAVKIHGPLPRTSGGNRNLVIMTDRFSKLTRKLPAAKTSSAHVANVSFDSFIDSHGKPAYVLTCNGALFTSTVLVMLCTMLGSRNLNTTAYHPQSDWQVDLYSCTIATRLQRYVA